MTDTQPTLSRAQLLAAAREADEWSIGSLRLRPFTAIGEERYSTYLKVV
jgi:hypothetical protein